MYSCQCKTCLQEDVKKESWYHGRTARCLYSRQGEHIAGHESGKSDNPLYKHAQLFHPNQKPEFVFETEKFFNDATSAQIFEGVLINNTPSDVGYLMNSRGEYQQGMVARVVLEQGLR